MKELEHFGEFLAIEDISELFKLHYRTVLAMCQDGDIPAIRVGKAWRIPKNELVRWIDEQLTESVQN